MQQMPKDRRLDEGSHKRMNVLHLIASKPQDQDDSLLGSCQGTEVHGCESCSCHGTDAHKKCIYKEDRELSIAEVQNNGKKQRGQSAESAGPVSH